MTNHPTRLPQGRRLSSGMTSLRSDIPLSVLLEHDLFRKPVSTPDQVRGRLFRDHALESPAFMTARVTPQPSQGLASSRAGSRLQAGRTHPATPPPRGRASSPYSPRRSACECLTR